MREKYILTHKHTEAKIGITYYPKRDAMVVCGGPKVFKDYILTVLGLFSRSRTKQPKEAILLGSSRQKERWAIRYIPRRKWMAGLLKLSRLGFEMRLTREFRRLMG